MKKIESRTPTPPHDDDDDDDDDDVGNGNLDDPKAESLPTCSSGKGGLRSEETRATGRALF